MTSSFTSQTHKRVGFDELLSVDKVEVGESLAYSEVDQLRVPMAIKHAVLWAKLAISNTVAAHVINGARDASAIEANQAHLDGLLIRNISYCGGRQGNLLLRHRR